MPAALALSVRATLDKPEVTLGEPFALLIEIVHHPADAVALPDDFAAQLDQGSLKLGGEPSTLRDRVPEGARSVFRVPLVVLSSLEPKVPDLSLPVQGPQGPRALAVPGQALRLKSLVQSEGEETDEHAHHGPKPPVPVYERSFLWLGLLVGLLALAAAFFLLRRLRRARAAVIKLVPEEAPEVLALRSLDNLFRRAPWNLGHGRAAIYERSEILRTYLGRRFAFNAVDLTNDELLCALRVRRPAGLDLDALAERLSWEDLVKFAKLEPLAKECAQAVEEARRLVEVLRPKLETTRTSPLADVEKQVST